jgi:hypothetical protein
MKEPEKMITVATTSQSSDPSPGIPEWFMLNTSVVLRKLANSTKATFRSDVGLELWVEI